MNSTVKRLILAFFISTCGFAATFFWYQSQKPKSATNENDKPIAYVGKVGEQILKKPTTKLLWMPVIQGDSLFDGEAIRTPSEGGVRIEFAEGNQYIDLEPDSLIILKKSADEISLDLKEGSLAVAENEEMKLLKSDSGTSSQSKPRAEKKQPRLFLKSAEGKINLTSVTANLSKSKSGDLDLKVIKGEAAIQNQKGETRKLSVGTQQVLNTNASRPSIALLSPTLDQKIPYSNASSSKVNLSWKFPDEAKSFNQVDLYIGDNKARLNRVSLPEGLTESTTQNLAPGTYYWKIVAEDPTSSAVAESRMQTFIVEGSIASQLISPNDNSNVNFDEKNGRLKFEWKPTEKGFSHRVQVFADKGLTQKTAQLDTTSNTAELTLPKKGIYFWRVLTWRTPALQPEASPTYEFSALDQFAWEAANGISRPLMNVQYLNANKTKNISYVGKPMVDLSWVADEMSRIKNWKIQVTDIATSTPVVVKENEQAELKWEAPGPGRFIASVEGFDQQGNPLTIKAPLELIIAEKGLLTAPLLQPLEGPIEASPDGESTLQWTQPKGAQEYELVFFKENKEVKKLKSKRSTIEFKNLLPGQYQVHVRAKDEYNRWSSPGPLRDFVIPDTSSLAAPKVRKIKVR